MLSKYHLKVKCCTTRSFTHGSFVVLQRTENSVHCHGTCTTCSHSTEIALVCCGMRFSSDILVTHLMLRSGVSNTKHFVTHK